MLVLTLVMTVSVYVVLGGVCDGVGGEVDGVGVAVVG